MQIGFIQPLYTILSTVIGTFSELFEYLNNGIDSLLSIAGVFPSFWSVVPTSITSIFLGIVVVSTCVVILKNVFGR